MPIREYHKGLKASISEYFVKDKDGCLTEFYSAIKVPDAAKDRLSWLLERMAEDGHIRNTEQFNFLEDGIYEFKPKNYRILCFFLEGHPGKCVVTTHYYTKQTNRAPRSEITKAKQIRDCIEQGGAEPYEAKKEKYQKNQIPESVDRKPKK